MFEKCHNEHILFIKVNKGGKILIINIYVNDLMFTKNDEYIFGEFKNSMMHQFDMSDLGRIRYFLGIKVLQRGEGIYICHRKYAMNMLKRFIMDEINLVSNPFVPDFKVYKDADTVKVNSTFYKQVVGNLMYLKAS